MTARKTAPLHLEEAAARDALIDDYVRRRLAKNVSIRQVAIALGRERTAVKTFERRRPSNSMISTLCAYGEVLELRPWIGVAGLTLIPSAVADALRAGGFAGPALLQQLIDTRKALRITQPDLAERVGDGWQWHAIADVERHDREPFLSTLQRYARGLGGQLVMRWEEL